jgi:hypothetical protein
MNPEKASDTLLSALKKGGEALISLSVLSIETIPFWLPGPNSKTHY